MTTVQVTVEEYDGYDPVLYPQQQKEREELEQRCKDSYVPLAEIRAAIALLERYGFEVVRK